MKNQSELRLLKKKKRQIAFSIDIEHESNTIFNLGLYINNLRFSYENDDTIEFLTKKLDVLCNQVDDVDCNEMLAITQEYLEKYGTNLNNEINKQNLNSEEFSKPDEYKGIGVTIELVREDVGQFVFRIVNVSKGSPAELGGVNVEDLISIKVKEEEGIREVIMRLRNEGINDHNEIKILSKNLIISSAVLKNNKETQEHVIHNFYDQTREIEIEENLDFKLQVPVFSDSDSEESISFEYKRDDEESISSLEPQTVITSPKPQTAIVPICSDFEESISSLEPQTVITSPKSTLIKQQIRHKI